MNRWMPAGVLSARNPGGWSDRIAQGVAYLGISFPVYWVGLLLILLVVAALREAVAMKRWPVAKGRIVSSMVEQYKEIAGAGKFGETPEII
jgi:ABC-type dipeptide/oligopeptide/nickel transport system permease component